LSTPPEIGARGTFGEGRGGGGPVSICATPAFEFACCGFTDSGGGGASTSSGLFEFPFVLLSVAVPDGALTFALVLLRFPSKLQNDNARAISASDAKLFISASSSTIEEIYSSCDCDSPCNNAIA
jgi:hypothetical protein